MSMAEKELISALLCGRPYFGPAMRASQGPPYRHQYLGAIVRAAAKSSDRREIRVLEIGSWAGASAITWAMAIQKLGRKGKVTCVDLWRPYFDLDVDQEFHYREMNEAAKGNKIFNLFLHNIRAANVSGMVDYVIGNARDVLPKLPPDKFDIIYIDGSHVYEDVCFDIRNAKRLIRNGGIICGDDLELERRNVPDAEHKATLDSRKDFVYSPGADVYYHPGVTEAVAVEFGEVSSWEGVWAIRKHGSKWVKVELKTGNLQIPDHIKSAAQALEVTQPEEIELVDATEDFNLVKTKGRFLAVAKKLGPTKLFTERLGERELAPLIFTGESLNEVREKSTTLEASVAKPVPELVSGTAGYNLVRVGEKFLAVAKSLGPLNVFDERFGERELPPVLFTGESLEEVREKALKVKQEASIVTELVGETATFNLVKSKARFLAVAKKLGPTKLFTERLGERELPPVLFTGESLEEVREKALKVEQEVGIVTELVGETATFNLVKSKARFLAVGKQLGPTELFIERLGERELAPLLFIGETLEEVREKTHAYESQTSQPEVELMDEVGPYNLVRAGERFIAVAKTLGPLNLFWEKVGERDLPPLILVATDPTALRQRIFEINPKGSKNQDLP
jgi:predicted O-methyltransferase YrrM